MILLCMYSETRLENKVSSVLNIFTLATVFSWLTYVYINKLLSQKVNFCNFYVMYL